jgi:ABC-type multidrug transport system fused ATPase/permease subunit
LFYYTTQLEEPIETIREELEQFQQAAASFQRIQALLAVQNHLQTGGQAVLPQRALSVQFEEVWFGYGEGPTLEGINFHLPAGKVLGLLGHTGSGKSTIARLLLRLYDIQKGEIQLGGINVNQVSLRELPHRVGLVTQDVQLFQTTVRNNLTFFNPHILDQHILQIIEDLGLMPWLASLSQGLDTMLGTDSSGLSAGQAQLLAFARVFLKDPGLVILDEASSQLDSQTEALIEKAVDRLLINRTGIIIAHRLETVARADQILILERGKVLEYGDCSVLRRDTHSRLSHLLATEFSSR